MSIARPKARVAAVLALLGALCGAATAEVHAEDAGSNNAGARLGPAQAGTQPIRLAGKVSSAAKAATSGASAARGDTGSRSEASQAQPTAPTGDHAVPRAERETDPDLIGGPFKVTVPGQGSAPAVVAEPPALRSTAPADAPARPAASNAGRPTADVGPTRTILEQGSPISSVEGNPPRSAGAAAGSVPTASATASATTANSSCLAGCYAPTSTRASDPVAQSREQRRSKVEPSPSAPAPVVSSAPTCVAGCNDGGVGGISRSTATASSPSAGLDGASAEKGTGRVTILRGNSRTKTYGVKD